MQKRTTGRLGLKRKWQSFKMPDSNLEVQESHKFLSWCQWDEVTSPACEKGKLSMRLAILCRTPTTSWFPLITGPWKLCRNNSWWWVCRTSLKCLWTSHIIISQAYWMCQNVRLAPTDSYLCYLAGIYKCSLWLRFKKKQKLLCTNRNYVAIKESQNSAASVLNGVGYIRSAG